MNKKVDVILKKQKSFLGRTSVRENFNLDKIDRLTIVSTIFFFPILLSIVLFNIKENVSNSIEIISQLNRWVVNLAIPIIGLIVCFARHGLKFFFNKIMIYYWWVIIWPLIISLISLSSSSTFSMVSTNVVISATQIINLVLNVIISVILIFFLMYRNNTILVMWKRTVKDKFIILIVVVSISIALYFLLNFLFGLIQKHIDPTASDNQNMIGFDKNSGFSIAQTLLLSVCAAPFIEEFIYRYILSNVLRNRWYAIFFTAVLFAFAHITSTLDWSHFIIYLPLGLVSGLVYYLCRNIFINITIHFLVNFIAFIVLLTQ